MKGASARAFTVALWLSLLWIVVTPIRSSVGLRSLLLISASLCLFTSFFLTHRTFGGIKLACQPHWQLHRPLVIVLVCWALFWSISPLWSINLTLSLSELRQEIVASLAAFGLFYGLAAVRTPHPLSRFSMAWCLGLLVISSLVLLDPPNALLSKKLWYVGPGEFSTHAILLLPGLCGAVVWQWFDRSAYPAQPIEGSWRHTQQLALCGVALLTLIALYLTKNRMAWISLAVGAVAFIYTMRSTPQASTSWRRWILLASVGFIGLFAALSNVNHDRLLVFGAPPQTISAAATEDPRWQLWKASLSEIRKAPPLGLGLGREIARSALNAHFESPAEKSLYWHAHNSLLNALLQGGIIGALLLVGLWVSLATALYQQARSPDASATLKLASAIGVSAVCAFAAKNMTDDFFVKHNAQLFWALMGVCLGAGYRSINTKD